MRAVMIMYDSLNRRSLTNYNKAGIPTPNFDRLAKKTVQFEKFYAGSLPCIPARRDLHTGRYSFLHRSWGPIEPFDNSMPEILQKNGIFTYLISDHYHYWEDGGCTYHTRYSAWDFVRGQEADTYSNSAKEPNIPKHERTMREFTHPKWWSDNFKNREIIRESGKWPQEEVFDKGLEFLEKNKDLDNWFLQIEEFDPHEPFDSPDVFINMFENKEEYEGELFDWPPYAPVTEGQDKVDHIRNRYAALLTMCDQNLGRILDFMDANDMWKDTMLIVNTDHGFLLGEKDWWAKSVMPCYNEICHIPFYLWDPESKNMNKKCSMLAQTIDIPATLLDYFNIEIPKEMQGKSLLPAVRRNEQVREYGLFGFHGSFTNITDGNYVYMKSSNSISNQPLNEYTLFPTRQQFYINRQELSHMESYEGFDFTKGCRVMKIPNISRLKNATFCNSFQFGDFLFDLNNDPEQEKPIEDFEVEAKMLNAMIRLMKETDAPNDQYIRHGIDKDKIYTSKDIAKLKKNRKSFEDFRISKEFKWEADAKHIFIGFLSLLPEDSIDDYCDMIRKNVKEDNIINESVFVPIAKHYYSEDENMIFYFLNKLKRIR